MRNKKNGEISSFFFIWSMLWSWRESNPSNLMADYQFVANILNGQSHAKSNELLFSKVVSYCECKDMKNDENIEEN